MIWAASAKALLEASYIAEKMKKAAEFGVTPGGQSTSASP